MVWLAARIRQTYASTIKPFGDASNIARFSELTAEANALPDGAGRDVRVLIDELPDGMRTKDGRLDYDHDRFVLLGEVSVEDNSGIGFWFEKYDSHEGWKNVYCNVQVPLNWITIYTWPALPFFWPCFKGSLKESERLEHMVAKLQNAALVLGGNLVVASVGSTSMVNVQTQQVVATSNMTHLVGMVLKDSASPLAPSHNRESVERPTRLETMIASAHHAKVRDRIKVDGVTQSIVNAPGVAEHQHVTW